MTAPIELVDTAVAAVQTQANELGLSWQMRQATVLEGATPSLVKLRMDGDELAVAVTFGISMVGPLPAGARVFVMSVPPAGQYVVGYVGSGLIPGTTIAYHRRESNSSTTTTEVGVVTLSATLRAGGLYQVYTGTLLADGNLANDALSTRFRYTTDGTTPTTGSTILHQVADVQVNINSAVDLALITMYQALVDTNFQVLLTIGRIVGAGTVGLLGSSTFPIEIMIDYKGPIPVDTGTDI